MVWLSFGWGSSPLITETIFHNTNSIWSNPSIIFDASPSEAFKIIRICIQLARLVKWPFLAALLEIGLGLPPGRFQMDLLIRNDNSIAKVACNFL